MEFQLPIKNPFSIPDPFSIPNSFSIPNLFSKPGQTVGDEINCMQATFQYDNVFKDPSEHADTIFHKFIMCIALIL